MSERALVFVYPPAPDAENSWSPHRHGWRAAILTASPGVLWEDDQNGGPRDASETGLLPPFEPGLWVWSGEIRYLSDDDGPTFVGFWERPSTVELVELADGRIPYVDAQHASASRG